METVPGRWLGDLHVALYSENQSCCIMYRTTNPFLPSAQIKV